MADMEQERSYGDWFGTSPHEDDDKDTETFARILLDRGRFRDERLRHEVMEQVTQTFWEIDAFEPIRVGKSGFHLRNGRIVSRHGSVDFDRNQVRTMVLNSPFRDRDDRHGLVHVRKIRWGMLVAQAVLTAAMAAHGQDAYAAISQILSVFGTFDTAIEQLPPEEAALLTAAHLEPPPDASQDWLIAANDLLSRWGVASIAPGQDLDDWLNRLQQRGIAVERSGPNNDHIRIRPMVLLVQW
ncbi:hypothetical protein [Burkholderia vietnamiensis]|uniref:hypothetical protein n=1 Tax=Burkholderia vietnamiensis TaxID=60552 RepID=UPI001CF423CA|nr:hypothetical protein [Burkholderia vietnamiensis]MCA8287619.1 hypothetical protein [Burkholderia vietnamiensis]